jgi:DNA mismatch repair protein MutS2
MQEETDDFPLQFFFDMRESIKRIRIEGTHLEENEIFDLRRSLETVAGIVRFLNRSDDDGNFDYPTLHDLTEGVLTFPDLIRRIDQILDKYGKIKDTASPRLAEIRTQLRKAEGSVSRTLYSILHAAQSEGLVDKDVTPTLRDGRLVVPIAPAMKRRIKGIVHDESSTGKTVFVEPTEVVEANNRIRELEADERREIIVILTEFTKLVRPHVDDIVNAYRMLAEVDFIRARAEFAQLTGGIEPEVSAKPVVDWITAKHTIGIHDVVHVRTHQLRELREYHYYLASFVCLQLAYAVVRLNHLRRFHEYRLARRRLVVYDALNASLHGRSDRHNEATVAQSRRNVLVYETLALRGVQYAI